MSASLAATVVVVVVLVVAGLVWAFRRDVAMYRETEAELADALAGAMVRRWTLVEAVALVIDLVATGQDDVVDHVSIDRDHGSPGDYVVNADVVHADGSTSYLDRRVYVPDDLDAPVGVLPVGRLDVVAPREHRHPRPCPADLDDEVEVGHWYYRSGCRAPECVAAHDRFVAAWRSQKFGDRDVVLVGFPLARGAIAEYLSRVAGSGLVRSSPQQEVALDPRDQVKQPVDVRVVGDADPSDDEVAQRSSDGQRGRDRDATDVVIGVGHESSPSVRTAPGATGSVDGAAALDTPPAVAPTVGDPTDTTSGPSGGVVPVDGPDGDDLGPSSPSGAADTPTGGAR